MNEQDFIKGMKFLGLAYGKEFTQDECKVYYEFIKIYTYNTFKNAIKSLIKKTKYLPKINEIIEECDKHKEQTKSKILEIMRADGYFKEPIEYEKACNWLESGSIPNWLKKDMELYYNKNSNNKILAKEESKELLLN